MSPAGYALERRPQARDRHVDAGWIGADSTQVLSGPERWQGTSMLNLIERRNRALRDRVLDLIDKQPPGNTLGMAMHVLDRLVRQDGDRVLHWLAVLAVEHMVLQRATDRGAPIRFDLETGISRVSPGADSADK